MQKFFSDNRKVLKLSLVISLALAGLLFLAWPSKEPVLLFQETTPSLATLASASSTSAEHSSSSKPAEFPVYITGAVSKPGVYVVKEGQYLYELVELAGGFLPEAELTAYNLASSLQPEMHIHIYSAEEFANLDLAQKTTSSLSSEADTSLAKVNLNTADQALLETLPGVGPATAKAIIKYRERYGPFSAITDLMLVPGIKEARYTKLADFITVD